MGRVKTNEIEISKAQPIGDDHAPSLIIRIEEPLKTQDSIQAADITFYNEAWKLGRALERSLPGGTFDRLLVYLLQRKASQFIVPHITPFSEDLSRKAFWQIAETAVRELGFTGWRVQSIVEEIVWQAEEACPARALSGLMPKLRATLEFLYQTSTIPKEPLVSAA